MRKIKITFSVVFFLGVLLAALALIRNHILESGASNLKSGSATEAKNDFLVLANLGDGRARELLGYMYAYGWGVDKDISTARYWFVKSRSSIMYRGDEVSTVAFSVASSYIRGEDEVTKNLCEARAWMNIAHSYGNKKASNGLYSRELRNINCVMEK